MPYVPFEWDVIHILHKKLKDPDLTVAEWTQAAKALVRKVRTTNSTSKTWETS